MIFFFKLVLWRVDIHRQKMTDAQELLAHVIVDPNDHDPEKRMESFNVRILQSYNFSKKLKINCTEGFWTNMNQSNRYSFHDMGRKDFLTILFFCFLKWKKIMWSKKTTGK